MITSGVTTLRLLVIFQDMMNLLFDGAGQRRDSANECRKANSSRFLLWSAYLHKTKKVFFPNSVGLFVFKM